MHADAHAPTLLEASGLGIERGGRQLFAALSLRVMAGEIVHLRGANGAGKTTLMRILAGLSRYGFDGEVQRNAACLFLGHQAAIKPLLSCRENLQWHLSGEDFRDEQALEQALWAVGLAGYEDVPAARLSAGQQRRVNLARLFLSSNPLWLLDEPFTAIDVEGVARLEARLCEHAARGGAVVLTSHQPLSAEVPVRVMHVQETRA